jgi:feruloyl esterase
MGVISSWVEKGKAPETITARKMQDGKVVATRPLCAYPLAARYKGKGDPNDAANFECAVPK